MSSNIIKNPLSKNEFLHEITIDDLNFDKNYGTYLKLKVNSDPILFASLQMMLKDKKNNEVFTCLYNYEKIFNMKPRKKEGFLFFDSTSNLLNSMKDFKKKLNNKNVIIINPFYKTFMDGNEGIRIDDPDEFILFDNDEKLEEFLKENSN